MLVVRHLSGPINFISPWGFYRVTFATSVFISYYFLLKQLYYSFNLSAAVSCVYLSCCCINKFILPLLLLLLLLLISAIYLVNEDY